MDSAHLKLGLIHIATSLVIASLAIPLAQGKVKMNKWYGFRIPKAYKSEEAWRKINEAGGKLLIYYSIPLFVAGVITCFLDKLEGHALNWTANAPLIYLIAVVHALYATRNV